MIRFHINLHITQNGKKISAIRDLRAATGMGLPESKTFVETQIQGYGDSFGGPLICNAEQAARIAVLHLRDFDLNEPRFSIVNMKEITDGAIDISHIVR
jgi:hypothetical protein